MRQHAGHSVPLPGLFHSARATVVPNRTPAVPDSATAVPKLVAELDFRDHERPTRDHERPARDDLFPAQAISPHGRRILDLRSAIGDAGRDIYQTGRYIRRPARDLSPPWRATSVRARPDDRPA